MAQFIVPQTKTPPTLLLKGLKFKKAETRHLETIVPGGPPFMVGCESDTKTPDSTENLFVFFLLLFFFSFFLWSTLCLFLFFPFAFVFTSFVTHVCFSAFKVDLRRHGRSLFVLIFDQSRTSMIEYSSGVCEGQYKTPVPVSHASRVIL